jgi:hypothetical protein
MKPKSLNAKSRAKASAETVVKDIRRATRWHFSAEDKIRIVLEGLPIASIPSDPGERDVADRFHLLQDHRVGPDVPLDRAR